jgi:6-hydroxynicotinate reductase
MTDAIDELVVCDACPVRCRIKPGRPGACDRYGNVDGKLARLDPLTVVERAGEDGIQLIPFLKKEQDWNGDLVQSENTFVTAVGAGTTYPDYKPAPFIVSSEVDGVDMVTVVTEGIYSYCGVKIKVDTDRHLGPETSAVRADGEIVGHVTTGEYGSQMMSLGGVHHLTGGSKKEGRLTCKTLMDLCNCLPVKLDIDDGVSIIVEAGKAPIIDDVQEERMRVGCGSATIGMFASQWQGLVDEVVVVDDHITGVLSEHEAGKVLDIQPTGISINGRRSTPGRYFRVAEPGTGWGGTDITDPLSILFDFKPDQAKPGSTMLMVSTTGEHFGYYVLDDDLKPVEQDLPDKLKSSVERIRENCEPAMCSVLFVGGAGGSLRAGVTENPVKLTMSVKDALTNVTSGGAETFVWPGGGITFMVDVTQMPENSFGYVPTPAIVAPIEFSMRRQDYEALGGHMDAIVPLADVLQSPELRAVGQRESRWPTDRDQFNWPAEQADVEGGGEKDD